MWDYLNQLPRFFLIPQEKVWKSIHSNLFSHFPLKWITFAWTGRQVHTHNTRLHLCVHFLVLHSVFFMFIWILQMRTWVWIHFKGLKLHQKSPRGFVCIRFFFSFWYVWCVCTSTKFSFRQSNMCFFNNNNNLNLLMKILCQNFYWYLFNDFICRFGILRYQNSFLSSASEQ